jgi:hypothetical protein
MDIDPRHGVAIKYVAMEIDPAISAQENLQVVGALMDNPAYYGKKWVDSQSKLKTALNDALCIYGSTERGMKHLDTDIYHGYQHKHEELKTVVSGGGSVEVAGKPEQKFILP